MQLRRKCAKSAQSAQFIFSQFLMPQPLERMKFLLLSMISFYRLVISPLKPPCCRFIPTCSQYALDAVRTHGAFKGGWLTIRRLARCHPFYHGPTFDPVPPKGK